MVFKRLLTEDDKAHTENHVPNYVMSGATTDIMNIDNSTFTLQKGIWFLAASATSKSEQSGTQVFGFRSSTSWVNPTSYYQQNPAVFQDVQSVGFVSLSSQQTLTLGIQASSVANKISLSQIRYVAFKIG